MASVKLAKSPNSKSRKATAKAAKAADRKVEHPNIYTQVFLTGEPAGPITGDKAKELLGWEEEGEKDKFGNKHFSEVSKLYGVKIRCTNNITNRPINSGKLAELKQEHLRRRWRFNGEPIIIGRTGLVLNGQHTLVSLLLAIKEWHKHPESYPAWESEPTCDKMIVFGVAEDDSTVNTMDTCKPRSLADIIYRAAYFKSLSSQQQKVASKLCEHAIRMLWKRTGIHIQALGTKQTPAESIAYLDGHPKILKAVRHIFDENDDNKIGKYLSPGYASAMLYLMGSAATESDTYYTADHPSEEFLDWSLWDKACQFWVELASGADKLKAIRDYLTTLLNQGAGTWQDRWAVLAKAWELYRNNKAITTKNISLKFEVKDDVRHLVEEPLIGGIDVGTDGVSHKTNSDPTHEEITNGKEAAKDKRFGKATNGNKANADWAAGDTAWVHSRNEDPYFCTLKIDPYECTDGSMKVMVDSQDGEWEVNVGDLSLKQFEKVS